METAAGIGSAEQQREWRKKYAREIETAREDYAYPSDDNIEIDDEPQLSPSDEGVWVSAWVYVRLGEEE